MKAHILLIGISIVTIGLGARTSMACSVCRCGDNAFLFSEKETGMPAQEVNYHFWLSLGNLYSTKANALGGDEGVGTEHQREFRPSLRLFYNPSDRISFSIEAPYQFRRIRVTSMDDATQEKSAGLGDIELSTVLTQHIAGGAGTFYTGGVSLTVKLPSGANDRQENGERIDEHLQSGTGATDWQIGAAASRLTCRSRSFASLYYRQNGTNDYTYHYGNAVLANVGAQWPLTKWLSGSVQLNGRHAERDTEESTVVENTGGWMTYLTPGVRLNLSSAASFSTAVQIPMYSKLYGDQTEKAVLSTGISYEW